MTNKQLAKLLIANEKKTDKIMSPEDVYIKLRKYHKAEVESFFVITLDGSHGIKRVIEITKGIVNRCLIHPREVFREAIKDGAVAIIVAHNHPSGNTKPSSEDKEITIKLIKAGEILGIPVLDHVIFTRYNFLGLAGTGKINFAWAEMEEAEIALKAGKK